MDKINLDSNSDGRVILHQAALILGVDSRDLDLYRDHITCNWEILHWVNVMNVVGMNYIRYIVISDSRFLGCMALEEAFRNF